MTSTNNTPATFDPFAIADRVLTISPIIEGKNKMTTDEIMAAYPDGLHITAVDFLKSDKAGAPDYVVINYAEDPSAWFAGGERLSTLFAAYLASDYVGGDLAVLNGYLAEHPIAVKLSKGKTKKGNRITLVEVIKP